MSKGTLLSYFNKPPEEATLEEETVEQVHEVQQNESCKRKTKEEDTNKGKRRKLSLSSLRHKQAKSEPLCNGVVSPTVDCLVTAVVNAENVKKISSPIRGVVNTMDKPSLLSMMKLEREKSVQLEKSKRLSLKNNKLKSSKSKENVTMTKSNEVEHLIEVVNDVTELKESKNSPNLVKTLSKFSESSSLKSAKDVLLSQQKSEVIPKIIAKSGRPRLKNKDGKPKKEDTSTKKEDTSTKKEDTSTKKEDTSTPLRKPLRKKCHILDSSDEEITVDKTKKLPKVESVSVPSGKETTGKRRSTRIRQSVIIIDEHSEDEGKKQKIKSPSKKIDNNSDIEIVSVIQPKKNFLSLSKAINKTPGRLMNEARKILSERSPDIPRRAIIPPQIFVPHPPWPRDCHVRQVERIIEHPISTLVLKAELSCDPITPRIEPFLTIERDEKRKKEKRISKDSLIAACPEISQLVEYYESCTNSNKANKEKTVVRKLEIYDDQEMRPWSTIYCPQNYKKLIGNKGCNKQLFRWLEGWKNRLLKQQRNRNKSGSSNDYNSEDEFTDYEEEDRTYLNNVVLLAGPVGVGKSGAINTCANQLGYKILELNSGSERTGKTVADVFSEASQSHSVTGRSGAADFTKLMRAIDEKHRDKKDAQTSKNGLENFFNNKGGKKAEKFVKGDKRKRKRSRKKSEVEEIKDLSSDNVRVEKMSLIVLEEIDIVFDVDKGFYSAIVALSDMALRPIILTSNNPYITLPTDAEFLTLQYTPPKTETCVNNLNALALSHDAPIAFYQLQQYCIKYSLGKCLRGVEMCTLSNNPSLTAMDLGVESFSPSNPAHWSPFLEQTHSQDIIYSYTNFDKTFKSINESDDKSQLLSLMKCQDTFVYLDLLSSSPSYPGHVFYPVEESSALVEEERWEENETSNVPIRAAVEAQLIRAVSGRLVEPGVARAERFKLKDKRRYDLIEDTHRTVAQDLNLTNHHDLTTIRTICQAEKLREEGNTKRRFRNYLKGMNVKQRERLVEYYLS